MTKSFISEEISCIVKIYNCSLQSFVHWFCLLIFHAKSLLSILSIHFTATGLSAFNCKKPWHFLSILLSNACRSDNSFDSTYRLLAFKCSKTQTFSFDSRDCFFFGGGFKILVQHLAGDSFWSRKIELIYFGQSHYFLYRTEGFLITLLKTYNSFLWKIFFAECRWFQNPVDGKHQQIMT